MCGLADILNRPHDLFQSVRNSVNIERLKMTNLERLKLELANKSYFTDTEYAVFLEENGLDSTKTYDKQTNQLPLLQTVLAILQALQNNLDLYRIYNTEFVTQGQAYSALSKQIDSISKRIAELPYYAPTAKTITYMFSN
jgi:hypothetical protein